MQHGKLEDRLLTHKVQEGKKLAEVQRQQS